MKILLLRHGATAGNELGRYIGRTDEPLSPRGIREVKAAGCDPALSMVYVTPLLRTRQTAEILFPNAGQIVVDGLRETDFGRFEQRSAREMENDPEYRSWVEGACLGACPGGESRDAFTKRVREAFTHTLLSHRALTGEKDGEPAVFVVHGGTIMAILEAFARPAMSFYEGHVENGRGFLCRPDFSPGMGLPFLLTDVAKTDRVLV